MVMPGSRSATETFRLNASTNLVLKLLLILDGMRGSQVPRHGIRLSSDALDSICALSGDCLAEAGTAFLWLSVHMVFESLDNLTEIPAAVWQLFITQLFDCYFSRLKDGEGISFPVTNGSDEDGVRTVLKFPLIGIQIFSEPQLISITRSSAATVSVSRAGTSADIKLSRPSECNMFKYEVVKGAWVLDSTTGLLLDPAIESKVARLNHPELLNFTKQVSKALGIIERADPALSKEINSTVHWYWPITTPDKRVVHNSFSVSTLHGGIFLSESYSYPVLAEALVHEFYHNQLSIFMTVEPHLQFPDDELLYSPWREDPRPLFGLYHGLYVFTGLLGFLERVEKNPELSAFHRFSRSRREAIYFQARTALSQVPAKRLMKRGSAIVALLREEIAVQGAALGLLDAPIPEAQVAHWIAWASINPSLVSLAAAPIGAAH